MATVATTPAEAVAFGKSHYFTGNPCLRGHVVLRRAVNRMCVECAKENAAQKRAYDLIYNEEYITFDCHLPQEFQIVISGRY